MVMVMDHIFLKFECITQPLYNMTAQILSKTCVSSTTVLYPNINVYIIWKYGKF